LRERAERAEAERDQLRAFIDAWKIAVDHALKCLTDTTPDVREAISDLRHIRQAILFLRGSGEPT
jgi:hypothetical protein